MVTKDVIIYINSQEPVKTETPSDLNSIIPYRVSSKRIYPPRRGGSAFINFYDLGQIITNGIIQDNAINADFPIQSGSNILDQINAALQINLADWKNRFRLIDYANAEKYRFSFGINNTQAQKINAENANFTSRGYKLIEDITKIEIAGQQLGDDKVVFYEDSVFGGLFNSFSSNQYKITALPNPDAAAVGLNISKSRSANVYLNQALFSPIGERVNSDSINTVTSVENYDINTMWFQPENNVPSTGNKQIAREQERLTTINSDIEYLDFRTAENDSENRKLISWARSKVLGSYAEDNSYENAQQRGLNKLFAEFGFKNSQVVIAGGIAKVYQVFNPSQGAIHFSYLWWAGKTSPESNANYPGRSNSYTPGENDTFSQNTSHTITSQTNLRGDQFLVENMLIAAIEQGENWFFIWKSFGIITL